MTVEPYRSPTLQARRAQMFPVLADEDIARLRRFGAPRRYADGECLFETGKTSPGMFVVLSGVLRITGRDGDDGEQQDYDDEPFDDEHD